MTKISLIKMFGVLLGLLLVAGACGDSGVSTVSEASAGSEVSTTSEVPTTSETLTDSEAPTAGDGGRFCDLSREFDDEDFNPADFGEEYFDGIDDLIGRVIRIAPDEIHGDMETAREGFRALAEILAEYDYNILDPDLATAMENLDSEEFDAASDRIDAFLERECGIADESSTSAPATSLLENIEGDAEGFVQAMMFMFGIDAEMAQCLSDELGEFDTANPDPELITKEVCGTTLLEIITNPGR